MCSLFLLHKDPPQLPLFLLRDVEEEYCVLPTETGIEGLDVKLMGWD